MRKFSIFFTVVFLASLIILEPYPVSAQKMPPPGTGFTKNFKAGQILVKFKDGFSDSTSDSTINTLLSRIQAKKIRHLLLRNVKLLQVPEGRELDILEQLNKEAFIDYAELNYIFQAFDTVPNDPKFYRQWGHTKIQSTSAWDISKGNNSISIAIIDSGIDETHPDLAGKIVAGYDFVDDDTNPHDEHGHGTHVSGIAAAQTNNSVGIAGAAWQTMIMPLRVLDEHGDGSNSDISDAIVWAYQHGAKIINMSLGGSTFSQTMLDAVNSAHDAGALIVAAMGNDTTSTPAYPAAYNNVMAVSATGPSDVKANYTNFGDHCDISAPGGEMSYYHDPGGIYSTMPTYPVYDTTSLWFDNNYDYDRGTSMAAPFVSGLASLVWALDPTMTQDDVQSAIEDNADDLGSLGWDQYYGHGRINAYKTLKAVLDAQKKPVSPAVLNLLLFN
ncbi:MAG: peptidase S8 [Deltaproteobacteria bacterium]|nr:peptidase S8 [Deltaproteobacteria bacterium]